MRWGQWGTSTYPLPSTCLMTYNPLTRYPMTALIHTLLPYILVFWTSPPPPPPVGNLSISFLFLYFYLLSFLTIISSTLIFDGGFPAPHCLTGIWSWFITVSLSSTVLTMLSLAYILFGVSVIYLGI